MADTVTIAALLAGAALAVALVNAYFARRSALRVEAALLKVEVALAKVEAFDDRLVDLKGQHIAITGAMREDVLSNRELILSVRDDVEKLKC